MVKATPIDTGEIVRMSGKMVFFAFPDNGIVYNLRYACGVIPSLFLKALTK